MFTVISFLLNTYRKCLALSSVLCTTKDDWHFFFLKPNMFSKPYSRPSILFTEFDIFTTDIKDFSGLSML